jgi:hypothetical protein
VELLLYVMVLLDCPDLPITLANPFKVSRVAVTRVSHVSRILGESISEYTLLLTNVKEK